MIPFEEVKEAISALGFWSALASGYHQDLQLFMGSAQSGANLFPELAELLHLTVKVLMVCSNDAVLALFHEILVVMEALIEGPCQPNQQQQRVRARAKQKRIYRQCLFRHRGSVCVDNKTRATGL